MALVCYRDGFVLVGSVSGQRYWSSLLDLEGCVISCGAWTPNDDKVSPGVKVVSINSGKIRFVCLSFCLTLYDPGGL